jgi:hypothetical protein
VGGARAEIQRARMCWLCTYQGEPVGARLGAFIIRHIGIMDMQCIAQQVSDYLLTNEPTAQGADKPTVYDHIARHMLHPRVRMAVLLRQLLEFSSLLQTSIVVNDAGSCTVDKGNAELYLKVIAQITTLYKVDIAGMLFADDEKLDKEVHALTGGGRQGPASAASTSSSSAAPPPPAAT